MAANTPVLQPLPANVTPDPAVAVRHWPPGIPLAVRWMGRPESGVRAVLATPVETRTARTGAELDALLHELRPRDGSPAGAGWFGWISYDAGACFEPAVSATSNARDDRAWPLAAFQRIESSLELDGVNAVWHGSENSALLPDARSGNERAQSYSIDPIDAMGNRPVYVAGVARAIEYIRAGDVYQVNLAHRLSAGFHGSPRSLFADLAEKARPWHGGYFETENYALASLSPELFLEAHLRTGSVRTRPMKGTRAFAPGADAAAARRELEASSKDRAELAMIVDLMRNDLGRVCKLGTVRVEQERRIEKHASGVLQSTATVAGALKDGTTPLDLLRATFPPGSVTGAPKIRAMQIIDELEPFSRGPYCGTMIWIGDDGCVHANVLIRSACISGIGGDQPILDYCVGAGIVADSDPKAEWEETMAKAGILTRLVQ